LEEVKTRNTHDGIRAGILNLFGLFSATKPETTILMFWIVLTSTKFVSTNLGVLGYQILVAFIVALNLVNGVNKVSC